MDTVKASKLSCFYFISHKIVLGITKETPAAAAAKENQSRQPTETEEKSVGGRNCRRLCKLDYLLFCNLCILITEQNEQINRCMTWSISPRPRCGSLLFLWCVILWTGSSVCALMSTIYHWHVLLSSDDGFSGAELREGLIRKLGHCWYYALLGLIVFMGLKYSAVYLMNGNV